MTRSTIAHDCRKNLPQIRLRRGYSITESLSALACHGLPSLPPFLSNSSHRTASRGSEEFPSSDTAVRSPASHVGGTFFRATILLAAIFSSHLRSCLLLFELSPNVWSQVRHLYGRLRLCTVSTCLRTQWGYWNFFVHWVQGYGRMLRCTPFSCLLRPETVVKTDPHHRHSFDDTAFRTVEGWLVSVSLSGSCLAAFAEALPGTVERSSTTSQYVLGFIVPAVDLLRSGKVSEF